MRNQTMTIPANESETVASLVQATNMIIKYGLPAVSGTGILFNTATIFVLSNRKKFKNNFYDFLICRCFCNLVVCCFGVFYEKTLNCSTCEYDYTHLFLNWYVLHFPIRVAFMASIISDNLIVLNRLANLYNYTTSLFFKLSKRVSFLTLCSFFSEF